MSCQVNFPLQDIVLLLREKISPEIIGAVPEEKLEEEVLLFIQPKIDELQEQLTKLPPEVHVVTQVLEGTVLETTLNNGKVLSSDLSPLFVKFGVNVKDFGAKGDGVTDDAVNIQKAIDYVSNQGGGTVYVSDGTYMIKADQVWSDTYNDYLIDSGGIKMRDNVHLVLSKGAILKAIPTASHHYNVINFCGVSNSSIKGGTLIGERHEHLTGGEAGEWGHGIFLQGSTNIHIKDMVIRDFYGDSIDLIPIYQGRPVVNGVTQFLHNSHIYIDNVICDGNRRQGMSIEDGQFIYVSNSTFKNIGGTMPESAVDIEPWGQYPNNYVTGNIYFTDCRFTDNAGGFVAGGQGDIDGVYLKDCYFQNNNLNGNPDGGQFTFYKPTSARTDNCVVDNCIFVKGSDSRIKSLSGVFIDSTTKAKITNNTFYDCNWRFGAGYVDDVLIDNNRVYTKVSLSGFGTDAEDHDDTKWTRVVISNNTVDFSKITGDAKAWQRFTVRGKGTICTKNTIISAWQFGTLAGNPTQCVMSDNTLINLYDNAIIKGTNNTFENNKLYNPCCTSGLQAVFVAGISSNILRNIITETSPLPIPSGITGIKTFSNPFWMDGTSDGSIYDGNIYPTNKLFSNEYAYWNKAKITNDPYNIGATTPTYASPNMQFYNTTLKKMLFKHEDGWYDAVGVKVP